MKAKDKIDVKIGTRKEKIWSQVKKEAEQLIRQSEDNLIIQKEMLALAKQKIDEEQRKSKKNP